MAEIHHIKCGTDNCYLVNEGENAILFDTGSAAGLEQVIAECSKYKMKLIVISHPHFDHAENAAVLSEKAKEYDSYNYCSETAFVIGNEGNGLTEETVAAATGQIYIPMVGDGESLNASMAAGILMYEANRQRRKGGI